MFFIHIFPLVELLTVFHTGWYMISSHDTKHFEAGWPFFDWFEISFIEIPEI